MLNGKTQAAGSESGADCSPIEQENRKKWRGVKYRTGLLVPVLCNCRAATAASLSYLGHCLAGPPTAPQNLSCEPPSFPAASYMAEMWRAGGWQEGKVDLCAALCSWKEKSIKTFSLVTRS